MQSSDLCKTKQKVNVRFVGMNIGEMLNQIIGIILTGRGMTHIWNPCLATVPS